MRSSPQTVGESTPAANPCKLVATSTTRHRAYIMGAIGDPKDFVDLIELLRTANPPTEIEVHINSFGGYLYTTLQIINAIRASRIPVTTVLDGAAYSGAGMVFLSGRRHRVEPFASLMCHGAASFLCGKMQEIKADADFSEADFRRIASDVYRGFLTAKEFKLMFHGEDLWFGRDEIVRRLGKKAKED